MARPPVDPRLWRYARSARRYLVVSVLLSLLITASIVVTAVTVSQVLAGVVTDPGRRTVDAWSWQLVIVASALTARVLVTWWQARLAHRAGASVVAELETEVLAAGARLAPRELDRRRTELAVVVSTGLSGLRGYLTGYLPALLLAAVVPPIVLAVIAVHDPMSGLIVVLTLPLIPVFMILIGLLTQGRAAATLAASTRLSDQLLDLFAGMPTLRALGREDGSQSDSGMSGRVLALGDALRHRTMRALRVAFLSSMVLEMLATLSVALVAVSIGLRLVFGDMSLYAGLVALILAPEVYLPLRTVGERFHAAQDGLAASDKAFEILAAAPPRRDAAPPHDRTIAPAAGRSADSDHTASSESAQNSDRSAPPEANQIAPAPHGAALIELTSLSVGARAGYAPDGLSGVLRPGTVTVLTGPNGSGKTTALMAILGLCGAASGGVTVDGVDVAELAPEAWWARVAWLPQRPVLVPGTLAENLMLLGAASDGAEYRKTIEKYCRYTGFDSVLSELRDGWETRVGPGGIGLSLGQRQRLALTRVLAAERPVLLLDEPTAHLDAESEAAILAALVAHARAGATVVVIGHRPSVLAAADHRIEVCCSPTAWEGVDA